MAPPPEEETLLPSYGGYRKLIAFQYAEVIYDVTVRFCDKYIGKRDRTHDQMVQAARSGKQNIAEGSMASGTSKKMELTLTNVARASLEELKLDYEDYLRTHELHTYSPNHPALMRFKKLKKKDLSAVRNWVRDELRTAREDFQGHTGTHRDGAEQESSKFPISIQRGERLVAAEIAANGALSLLNICCMFLDRQVATLAKTFQEEGGFSERLYRVRKQTRDRNAREPGA